MRITLLGCERYSKLSIPGDPRAMAEGRSKIGKGRGKMAERVELTWEAGKVGGSESCKLVRA